MQKPKINKSFAFLKHVEKCLKYIKDGDIFQANITQRFLSKIPNDLKSVQYN